eukprot:6194592-Pleurochrysis_carterae.AAC.1
MWACGTALRRAHVVLGRSGSSITVSGESTACSKGTHAPHVQRKYGATPPPILPALLHARAPRLAREVWRERFGARGLAQVVSARESRAGILFLRDAAVNSHSSSGWTRGGRPRAGFRSNGSVSCVHGAKRPLQKGTRHARGSVPASLSHTLYPVRTRTHTA